MFFIDCKDSDLKKNQVRNWRLSSLALAFWRTLYLKCKIHCIV